MISKALAAAMILSLSFNVHAKGGLRERRTVLNGVLVSAGGAGGQHSLADSTVNELCEEGFSTIFYLYPGKNFSNKGTHNCGGNTVDYVGGGFSGSGLKTVFKRVQQVADHGGGPVLVHCWNGRHAAGAVAAMALVQFCGWSGSQAESYWLKHAIDGEGMAVRKQIRNFQPYSEFGLSASQRASLCP
jgi:hypothetical protein